MGRRFSAGAEQQPAADKAGEPPQREDEKQDDHHVLRYRHNRPGRHRTTGSVRRAAGPQFVNRLILTFRMRPNAASVAMIEEPP